MQFRPVRSRRSQVPPAALERRRAASARVLARNRDRREPLSPRTQPERRQGMGLDARHGKAGALPRREGGEGRACRRGRPDQRPVRVGRPRRGDRRGRVQGAERRTGVPAAPPVALVPTVSSPVPRSPGGSRDDGLGNGRRRRRAVVRHARVARRHHRCTGPACRRGGGRPAGTRSAGPAGVPFGSGADAPAERVRDVDLAVRTVPALGFDDVLRSVRISSPSPTTRSSSRPGPACDSSTGSRFGTCSGRRP